MLSLYGSVYEMQLLLAWRLLTFSIFLSTICISKMFELNDVSATLVGKPGIMAMPTEPCVVEVPVLVMVQEHTRSFLQAVNMNASNKLNAIRFFIRFNLQRI